MSDLLNPKSVIATTLSVLQNENDSILCFLDVDGNTCNVNLNFNHDDARLLGFPHLWKLHNESVDGNDEFTYEDALTDSSIESIVHEMESIDVYVSKEMEINILQQLKASLLKQFNDEMFKDHLSSAQQEIAISKIDSACKKLQ